MTTIRDAESKREAVARLYALAGVPPEPLGPGSKEKKSVLVGLAHALDLDVDAAATKPLLGGQVADALGTSWDASCYSTGATLTLRGLNTILRAATSEVHRRHYLAIARAPMLLEGWSEFRPARSKLEAVNRLSALTSSGPQSLGPGSKERKSVLVDLTEKLQLGASAHLSKTRLGEEIALRLGMRWDSTCWSAGETITLDGLNVLLAGAERQTGLLGTAGSRFPTVRHEADAMLGVLHTVVRDHWDGRSAVEEMRSAEYRQWRQLEWFGFYFEFVGIPALIDAFGGGPIQIGAVTFDYQLETVWDLKGHSHQAGPRAPLNDSVSIRERLKSGSIGFLMLAGDSTYDDSGEFDQWHRAVTTQPGRRSSVNSAHQRRRKAAFSPKSISAYVIENKDHHDELMALGALAVMNQGRQQDGSPRPPKHELRVDLAEASGMRIAHVERTPA